MKASILFGIACVGSCISGSNAGFFGGSDDNSKSTRVENPQAAPFKLDYKLSFKKPYYYNSTVPFWQTSGDVIKAEDFIRLAPSVPGSKGQIWSTIPNSHAEWEVNMQLRISGQHVGGGRGMAFWYAAEPNQDGPIFGSKDKWNGLGIWFDSYNPKTKSPMTMALVNDGTKQFASKVDPTQHMLGSCFQNYRNTYEPLYVKVTYRNKTLSVLMDRENRGSSYRHCFRKQDVELPTGYFFGLSASSQNPADDHDVITLETWELNPPAKLSHLNRPMEAEKVKKGQKFEGLDDVQKQGAVLDQQHRLVEELKMVQLQLQTLGAPGAEDIASGNIEDILKPRTRPPSGATGSG
ncbi:legume-like lectin family-domain-containing protein [Umbelopsis sp. AD052]|nr:legume-like lectin family-domain-containing protein [Umbelopsis sp. AD052]